MLNRKICGKMARPVTLIAVLSLFAIGLIIPQPGFAQIPDITGLWTGTIVVSNPSENVTSTADLTSSTTAVSGSVTTNSSELASSDVASSEEAVVQPAAECAGCALPPPVTSVTLLFTNITVNLKGSMSGSDASGSFSATDSSTGQTISGTASGTVTSTAVSLSFSGTNNLGEVETGTLSAHIYVPPPPPPPEPCAVASPVNGKTPTAATASPETPICED
jgi:hypothetical protein